MFLGMGSVMVGMTRLEKSKKLLLEGCRCIGEKAKRLPKQLEEANKRKGNRETLKATLGEICRKLQQKNKVTGRAFLLES